MTEKKRNVIMPKQIVATEGVCVACGVINRGANDGLQFVFISTPDAPTAPLVAIPVNFAILAIKQISDSILSTLDTEENEYASFVQSKLLDISDLVNEIVDSAE